MRCCIPLLSAPIRDPFFQETHQFQDIPDGVFAFIGRNAVAGTEKIKISVTSMSCRHQKNQHVADEVSDSIRLLNDGMPQDVSCS